MGRGRAGVLIMPGLVDRREIDPPLIEVGGVRRAGRQGLVTVGGVRRQWYEAFIPPQTFEFATAGTFDFEVPSRATRLEVVMIAGGGGGGNGGGEWGRGLAGSGQP